MEMKTTYGLRPDQMAGLFSVGSDDPDPHDREANNERMTHLLQEQLACTLPEGSLFCDALLMMMERLGWDLNSLSGQSLGQLLLSAQSDIELLKTIKDSSKTLLRDLDSHTDTALATVTYYAALASVLVHHDQKISQYSFEKLSESFAQLSEKQWMTEELVALYSKAQRICESRCKSE
jgi:hypothetical protein